MSRDTQFQGFASSLGAEIADTDGWNLADVEKLIARRAYDLVHHAIYCNGIDSAYWPGHPLYGQASDIYERGTTQDVSKIPDLTELPREREVTKDAL